MHGYVGREDNGFNTEESMHRCLNTDMSHRMEITDAATGEVHAFTINSSDKISIDGKTLSAKQIKTIGGALE